MKAQVVKVQRTLIDQGVHNVRVFALIDEGTQKSVFNSKVKEQHKITLGVEFVDSEYETIDGSIERFVLWPEYSLPISGKSFIKRDLEAILGIEIAMPTGDEPMDFEMSQVVGRDAQVVIVHKKSEKTGETYHNIANFLPTPKGKDGKRLKIAPLTNDTILFDLEDFDKDVYDKIPQWIQKKIIESPEFKENVLLNDDNNAKLQTGKNAAASKDKAKPAVKKVKGK